MQRAEEEGSPDPAEGVRRARFGTLPKRFPLEETFEERPASLPDPAKSTYHPDEWLVRYCL